MSLEGWFSVASWVGSLGVLVIIIIVVLSVLVHVLVGGGFAGLSQFPFERPLL
jgi:hypothetical protein